MKKTFPLKILIFCLCSHFFADVANSVKSVCALGSPFCLSKKTDGALLGAGIFLSGADLFLDNVLKINQQTFDENRSFEKKSVNGFDRLFMNDYNFLLDKVGGNIFLCSAMASPIFILGKSQKSEWKTVGLMYAETLLIANGIKELVDEENREFFLKKALEPLREKYDFILIDCPPSLGILTLNGLAAADSVIVPMQCEYFALEGNLSGLLQTVLLHANIRRQG